MSHFVGPNKFGTTFKYRLENSGRWVIIRPSKNHSYWIMHTKEEKNVKISRQAAMLLFAIFAEDEEDEEDEN